MGWHGSIGIDIGLEAKHTGFVLDSASLPVRSKAVKFGNCAEELESFVSRFAPDVEKRGETVVSMEPTGNGWVLLSAFFKAKGFRVFLVKTQKSHDFRKVMKRNAKTDALDAKALAKLPFSFPEDMNEYVPPSPESASLERLIKARETFVSDASGYKKRIYSHFQLLNPFVLKEFGDNRFTLLARAFYERYADPFKAVSGGRNRFHKYLSKHGYGSPSPELIDSLYESCVEAAKLHRLNGEVLPYQLETHAMLVRDCLETIVFLEAKINKLEKQIRELYEAVDPDGVLKTMKGFGGNVVAPGIIALSGPLERFPNAKVYLGFIGLVSKASQSSTTNTEGMRITKTGKKLLKKYYCIAAETARQWDVEAAAFYHRLINKGKHHNQAICAVANMLARRVYAVMKRRNMAIAKNDADALTNIGYQMRDLEGKPITPQRAREMILRDYPSKKSKKEQTIMIKEKAA